MAQLEDTTTDFNQTVTEVLDEVFATLESDRLVVDDVVATGAMLSCCIEQVRRIRAAASAADMPGLHWVCSLIERNLISLHHQNRLLSEEEFALLSEWPELLASYSVNHGDCKIDELIWHLGASTWPAPLLEVDSNELRHLLECDPGNCCCEGTQYHGLSLVPEPSAELEQSEVPAASAPAGGADYQDAQDVQNPSDPHLAMHEALDALIMMMVLDDVTEGTVDNSMEGSLFYRYAHQLQSLSACAAASTFEALETASEVFSQVLLQRAQSLRCMGKAESDLLNAFPMLAMEYIAMPEDTTAATALLDVAFNPLWDSVDSDAQSDDAQECAPTQMLSQEQAHEQAHEQAQAQAISQEMLGLLAKEIALMTDMLAEDLAAVVAPGMNEEARQQALGNYADVLARIGATAESVGLLALHIVFHQLQHMVLGLRATVSSAQHELLAQLPEKLLAYLAAPNDREQCVDLLALLSSGVWPEPMAAADATLLVDALAQVVIVAEEQAAAAAPLVVSATDVSLALPKDINVELLDGLLQELPIQVASFTQAIESLVAGKGSMADVEQAKRAAHTLKGAANTVGVAGIASLTHHLEDLLIGLTQKQTLPEPALATLLMEAADCLEAMGEAVLGTGPAPTQALEVLQQVLDFIEHGQLNTTSASAGVTVTSTLATVNDLEAHSEAQLEANSGEPSANDATQMLRVPAPVVDELLRLAGENVISNAQIQERLRQTQKQSKAIQKQDALFQKLIAELENLVDVRGLAAPRHATVQQGDFDPLEFERYSELHTITSQLIEARTDAAEMSDKIDEELTALGELLEVQRRLQMENQHAVIRTRLVPVSSVVSRLQRSVRQTCRLLDKQVELKITGEATSVDSNMLHELTDPLMHILRNAVDHGIEMPGDRVAAHKSAQGLIELSFAREGNSIVVRCKDDGAGLDYAAIRRTALQRHMLASGANPSDEELGRLILMPGFSTRDTTTQTSGRGIGMDVVYTSILDMKGSLKLLSSAGKGLTVELRLPATLLSEHTLMARIGGKMLAVSSRRILDIHYITPEQIDHIGEQQVYRVGDAVHPLLRLDALLGLPAQINEKKQLGYPILLTSTDAGASCAILVQELVDGREVVVKKLGRYVPKIAGTIGAVILGDGSVAPVIDLPELLRASSRGSHAPVRAIRDNGQTGGTFNVNSGPIAVAKTAATRIALIVDDSLSARRAAAQIMRDAGYEVRTAIDGLDAVSQLEQLVPDVILVDMEMPRMNGLEQTSHVRGRAQLADIPIIMITSRSTEKHRQQGDAAGVNAYLVKPFNEDELLRHIDHLVGHQAGASV